METSEAAQELFSLVYQKDEAWFTAITVTGQKPELIQIQVRSQETRIQTKREN